MVSRTKADFTPSWSGTDVLLRHGHTVVQPISLMIVNASASRLEKPKQIVPGLWACSGFDTNLGGTQEPERVPGSQMMPGMISGVGVKPMLGRDFLPDEGQPGRDRGVRLRHKVWARRFGSRPDIVGRQIQINGEPYTVAGVLLPGQQDRMPDELEAPLPFKLEQINHDFHWLLVMGRLKPGVSIKEAQSDMDAVTRRVGQVYPQDKGWSSNVEPLRNGFLPREGIASLCLTRFVTSTRIC